MLDLKVQQNFNVHHELASRTRDAHQSLHHHPLISQLVSPSLTANGYQMILSCYHGFFQSVETRREQYAYWAEFSLQSHIENLQKDLRYYSIDQEKRPSISLDWLQCKVSILGALYVLHGSGFGARVIAKQLNNTLPEHPHHFFSQNTNKRHWQQLLNNLSLAVDTEHRFELLVSSAQNTFYTLGRTVK
ncbi:MAG: biliverdin-producing heme oxygenase [Pseudomonadota bacterium]